MGKNGYFLMGKWLKLWVKIGKIMGRMGKMGKWIKLCAQVGKIKKKKN